jgi:hypothetical protein
VKHLGQGHGEAVRPLLEKGEGLLVIFRNDSSDTSATVTIPGFPDGHFHVSQRDATVEGKLLRDGWPFDLRSKPKVFVMAISRDQYRF